MPEKLTDRLVKALPVPETGAKITYDTEVKGFGVRVTSKGVRSFVLNYVVHGHERRITIGQFPAWSSLAAREQALKLRRTVDLGEDPLAARAAEASNTAADRAAPTVLALFERYAAEHLPRKAEESAKDDRRMWEQIILPRLGRMKVKDVTHVDIDTLHASVSETRPIRANRVIEVVRKAFNLAMRWGWRPDNPATGVRRNPEEKRTRYLSPEEIARLWEALCTHPERTSADAIKLLLLTGARRGEVLSATWDMFVLDNGRPLWIKPSSHTKQRKEHRAPISDEAAALLLTRKEQAAGPFVFPGRTGNSLTDLKRTWQAVTKAAGLQGVRLHDLRHTYASLLVSQGVSLPTVGALLGHTQPITTSRYAHLMDDPLRAATETVAAVVTSKLPI